MIELLEKQVEFEQVFRHTPSTKSVLEVMKDLDTDKLFTEVEAELEKHFTLIEMPSPGIISVRNDKRKNIQTTITSIEDVIEEVLQSTLEDGYDIHMIMSMLFHVESMSSGRSIYISVRRN